MLETILEYARDRLAESGEADEVAQRHYDYFLALAERAGHYAEAGYRGRAELVPPDQDNFRAAIDWAAAAGRIELALELAFRLENFWVKHDPFEGMRRFEALLSRADGVDPMLRARALGSYGGSCHIAGEFEKSLRAQEESVAILRTGGDEKALSMRLLRIANTVLALGDKERAQACLDEGLELAEKVGWSGGRVEVVGSLGYMAADEGDHERAVELFAESTAGAAEIGFTWFQVGMLCALAESELLLGRLEEGERHAREGLLLARQIEDRPWSVGTVVQIAWAAALRGDGGRAGRLWGAALAEIERAPVGQFEQERDLYEERMLVAAGPEFTRAREEGGRLSFGQAVEEALG
jgi:tetratricopeptide (TPR) repeat protein